MANIFMRASVLVVLAGLAGGAPRVRAEDRPEDRLTLKSGYSGKWLAGGARRVHLTVTLGEKGNGSGTLTLDPNIYEGATATQIAIQKIPVGVRLAHDEEAAAKGRRLYELRRSEEEGKVDKTGEHWLLVRPLKAGAPCWLVFVDKDGKVQDVLMLE
jgi:hypothetical protein